jgi:hypothetical protein
MTFQILPWFLNATLHPIEVRTFNEVWMKFLDRLLSYASDTRFVLDAWEGDITESQRQGT